MISVINNVLTQLRPFIVMVALLFGIIAAQPRGRAAALQHACAGLRGAALAIIAGRV